jgi:beta-hydroxylase
MKTAMFSILAPGKHVPPHRGPYKGVLRYHLALLVPQPRNRCRIRIADQLRHFEEGKSLLFDDTFVHEVWNESSGHRAVLFVDIVRPLPWPLSWMNRLAIWAISRSPFVYPVPFVEDEHTVFLKTILPSRKAMTQYLGEESDDEEGR